MIPHRGDFRTLKIRAEPLSIHAGQQVGREQLYYIVCSGSFVASLVLPLISWLIFRPISVYYNCLM